MNYNLDKFKEKMLGVKTTIDIVEKDKQEKQEAIDKELSDRFDYLNKRLTEIYDVIKTIDIPSFTVMADEDGIYKFVFINKIEEVRLTQNNRYLCSIHLNNRTHIQDIKECNYVGRLNDYNKTMNFFKTICASDEVLNNFLDIIEDDFMIRFENEMIEMLKNLIK